MYIDSSYLHKVPNKHNGLGSKQKKNVYQTNFSN